MQTQENLKRQIKVAGDLHSVVKTMKALAAVSIRQYEEAVRSLVDFTRTVRLGLRIVLRNHPQAARVSQTSPRNRLGAIVLGSDQGMCGQINDQVVDYTLKKLREVNINREHRFVLAIGLRVASRLEDAGEAVEMGPAVPSSIEGITPTVEDILLLLDNWLTHRQLDHVILFYSRHESGVSLFPYSQNLLPVDQQWLHQLGKEDWPSREVPTFTMDGETLFSALIRQYLFISLYQGFAEALASENASRLASMQSAERNIEERLAMLEMDFNQQRQMAITSELLDIVSGFEALSE